MDLYKKIKADSIISDDRRFLNLLEREGINFIIPTDLIAILAKTNRIKQEDAIRGLNKIRWMVTESSYIEALKYLKGD